MIRDYDEYFEARSYDDVAPGNVDSEAVLDILRYIESLARESRQVIDNSNIELRNEYSRRVVEMMQSYVEELEQEVAL